MRELSIGLNASAVKHWQEFLRGFKPEGHSAGFYSGEADGMFDYKLRRATKVFQQWVIDNPNKSIPELMPETRLTGIVNPKFQHGTRNFQVAAHGRVDIATLMAAKLFGFVPEPMFKMGPDITVCSDLRESRPYFLVPLPEPPPPLYGSDTGANDTAEDADSDMGKDRKELRRRIGAWIRTTYRDVPKNEPNVTDLYIFSHGWHRNFYQAVSAYDRLASRISRLIRSGRFDEAGFTPSRLENFRPLFLNLHWHSDPGEDDFIDKSGRRDKTSFMQRVALAFEPKDKSAQAGIQMTKDFEDIFALCSRMAAPDTRVLSNTEIKNQSEALFAALDNYQLKDIPEPDAKVFLETAPIVKANRPVKTGIVWTCYHEADSRQVTEDQDEKATPFISFPNAVMAVGKFVAGLVGASALATLLAKTEKLVTWPVIPHLPELPKIHLWHQYSVRTEPLIMLLVSVVFYSVLTSISYKYGEIPGATIDSGYSGQGIVKKASNFVKGGWILITGSIYTFLSIAFMIFAKIATRLPSKAIHWIRKPHLDLHDPFTRAGNLAQYSLEIVTLLCLAGSLGWVLTWLMGNKPADKIKSSGMYGLAMTLLFWAPIQLAISVPVAFYLLFTYLLGPSIGSSLISNLFDEKDHTAEPPTKRSRDSDFRDKIAAGVRYPIRLLKRALKPGNSLDNGLDTVDGTLAFYEMQRKGVASGHAAANFLCELFHDVTELQDSDGKPHPKMRIHLFGHSFGALVVANLVKHLNDETKDCKPANIHTLCLLQGAIGSDWFKTLGRLSGYVDGSIATIYSRYDMANGLYYPIASNGRMAAGFVGMSGNQIKRLEHFVLLVQPPNLKQPEYQPDDKQNAAISDFSKLNLDASRIIYAGAPATGGAHTDIFKDDVVHLLWAVSRVRSIREPSTSTA